MPYAKILPDASWLAMCKLLPKPVSYEKALPRRPSASDLPRPCCTRKPCPRPSPPGWPCASCLCRSGARCASLFFASNSLWGGAPRRLSRPKENSKQKRETRTVCTQRPPTAPCLFLKSHFFASNSLRGRAPCRVATCAWSLSLFLNRARSGDTLTCRRAATPCHAEARRVHRVAVGRADCSRLLSHRCSRALRWSLAHGNGQRHVSLNSLPRCGACNVCAWSLNRAHRSGAGHALARKFVRAAILTAGAHSRRGFVIHVWSTFVVNKLITQSPKFPNRAGVRTRDF